MAMADERDAIRELIERYADAVMRRDDEAWASTWADEDAEWHLQGHPELSEVQGKAMIVASWRKRIEQFEWVVFMTQVGIIHVEEDVATVRSYTSETFGLPGGQRSAFGRYDDELVREGGAWRFRIRRFTTIARHASATRREGDA